MKKIILSTIALVAIAGVVAFKALSCPSITIMGPPTTVHASTTANCGQCGSCGKPCSNSFTLSTAVCDDNYTWTFNNTTTGTWSCALNTTSPTRTLSNACLRGSVGDNISLVISVTGGGASSQTYNFTVN